MKSDKYSPLRESYPQTVSYLEFAGWSMPRDFSSIVGEHRKVRDSAGLFDISHMGRLVVRGPDVAQELEQLFSRRLTDVSRGRALYGFFCATDGHAIDDDIVYLRSPEEAWLVTNAVGRDSIRNHVRENTRNLTVEDRTEETALLALQGPEAENYYDVFDHLEFPRAPFRASWSENSMVASTGYTGEPGCELWLPVEPARQLFDRLLEAGVLPCGLGARDSLRLEAGFPLHGNELTQELDPVTVGLDQFIDWNHDFIGRSSLRNELETDFRRKLQGLVADGRRSPREGSQIRSKEDGSEAGRITSGGFSPVLNRGVAIGLVPENLNGDGELEFEIRSSWHSARQVDFPLHENGDPA